MNLLLGHSQTKGLRGYNFRLWACFDLNFQEKELVDRYGVKNRILSEGDPLRDLKHAAWWAAPAAALVMLLVYGYSPIHLSGPNFYGLGLGSTILVGLASFGAIAWFVYHHIREEIRVGDIIAGRNFACRSVLKLVEKERTLLVMAGEFRRFLEILRTWDGQEVIPIELPPKPGLRLDAPQDEAA
jgi:hypothetical protein